MSITIPAAAWVEQWTPDPVGVLALLLAAAYLVAAHRGAARGTPAPAPRRTAFLLGCLILAIVSCGPVTHYAVSLFWVRALQITVLLYLVPLALACGTPLRVFGAAAPPSTRRVLLRGLRSRPARVLTHPAVASPLLLVTPWLLLFTGWNVAAMRSPWLDVGTRLLLSAIGFLYFWSRVQADPVPRGFPPGLSMLLTVTESLGDGVLGIAVWLSDPKYVAYYATLGFTDRGQLQLSQTIGAGMLWILADVIGLPFLAVLMASLRRADSDRQVLVDAALDRSAAPAGADGSGGGPAPSASGLWWEQDPELRDRFRH